MKFLVRVSKSTSTIREQEAMFFLNSGNRIVSKFLKQNGWKSEN